MLAGPPSGTELSDASCQIHEDSTVKESIDWRQRFTAIVLSVSSSPPRSLDYFPTGSLAGTTAAESTAPLPGALNNSTPLMCRRAIRSNPPSCHRTTARYNTTHARQQTSHSADDRFRRCRVPHLNENLTTEPRLSASQKPQPNLDPTINLAALGMKMLLSSTDKSHFMYNVD